MDTRDAENRNSQHASRPQRPQSARFGKSILKPLRTIFLVIAMLLSTAERCNLGPSRIERSYVISAQIGEFRGGGTVPGEDGSVEITYHTCAPDGKPDVQPGGIHTIGASHGFKAYVLAIDYTLNFGVTCDSGTYFTFRITCGGLYAASQVISTVKYMNGYTESNDLSGRYPDPNLLTREYSTAKIGGEDSIHLGITCEYQQFLETATPEPSPEPTPTPLPTETPVPTETIAPTRTPWPTLPPPTATSESSGPIGCWVEGVGCEYPCPDWSTFTTACTP